LPNGTKTADVQRSRNNQPTVALQKKRRSVDSGALQGSFRVWVGHLLFPELDKIYCEAKEKITIGIRWK
jgi:hypothetical protein